MKLFAFYFPQFHQTPENSRWWGEGFTDWNLVKQAVPLEAEHYQPRIPCNGRYYDQADADTVAWQAELAQNHGLSGFNFYHYWFDGKLMLEKPMELFRDNPDHQLEYCITWANETWTRQWVGNPEVLIKQSYSDDRAVWRAHFDYLLTFFQDERYLKREGCPVLCIYRPELHSHLEAYLSAFDRWAQEAGFNGVHFVAISAYQLSQAETAQQHFVSVIRFQPRIFFTAQRAESSALMRYVEPILRLLPETMQLYLGRMKAAHQRYHAFSYEALWQHIHQLAEQDAPQAYQSVVVDWDNTARYGKRARFFNGATPEAFGHHLAKLAGAEQRRGKEWLFINAWNEWSEGAYLEPDERFGYRYLDAVKQVRQQLDKDAANVG